MELHSKFSPRNKAWISLNSVPYQGTVGQVRIIVTDSPGRPGETLFDNYKPQKDYVEEYMLVETGIGSGSVYTLGVHIFETEEECNQAIIEYLREQEKF